MVDVRVVVAAVDDVVVALFLKSLLPGVAYISRLAILAHHHSGDLQRWCRHREQGLVTGSVSCPLSLIINMQTLI